MVKKKQSRKKRKENTAPNELPTRFLPKREQESYDDFGANLDVSTVHYLKKCQLMSQDVSYMSMSSKL